MAIVAVQPSAITTVSPFLRQLNPLISVPTATTATESDKERQRARLNPSPAPDHPRNSLGIAPKFPNMVNADFRLRPPRPPTLSKVVRCLAAQWSGGSIGSDKHQNTLFQKSYPHARFLWCSADGIEGLQPLSPVVGRMRRLFNMSVVLSSTTLL